MGIEIRWIGSRMQHWKQTQLAQTSPGSASITQCRTSLEMGLRRQAFVGGTYAEAPLIYYPISMLEASPWFVSWNSGAERLLEQHSSSAPRNAAYEHLYRVKSNLTGSQSHSHWK